MFPFNFFARTVIAAAILSALIAAPTIAVSASLPQLKAVPGERVGDVRALDDTARPTADTVFHLVFAVNSNATSGLATFVNSQSDPTSPNYHKWLTPTEFAAKFGANANDIAAVSQYLTNNNLSNVKVWSNNLFVSADITRAQAEKLFGVTIHGYDRTPDLIARGYSKTYFAPDQQPKIDTSIANRVKALIGLSNEAERLPATRPNSLKPFVATSGALDPPDISKAYNIDTLHSAGLEGQGITIAVFSPTLYAESDVAAFFAAEKITEPTINEIQVDGGPVVTTTTTATATTGPVGETITVTGTGQTQVTTTVITTETSTGGTPTYTTTTLVSTPDYTGAGEACLDLETIGGQAPDATLDVYEGPNTTDDSGPFAVFNQIATDDIAQVVSDSWGVDETLQDQAQADSYDDIRAQLSAEGITIFVASGDSGAYAASDPTFTIPSVAIDASSSYVTAVGGTELTLKNGAWSSEVAWTFNDLSGGVTESGSNGGLSIFYPRPVWQAGLGVLNKFSNGFRQIPDVAALAGGPGYDIYTGGVFGAILGTSGACPLWAAAFSLIEQQLGERQGNINPALYGYATNASSVYHDITSGNNGVYTCTPGWDYVTGWGSADFATLLSAFEGNSVATNAIASVHAFNSGIQFFTIPYSYTGTGETTEQLLTGLVTRTGAAAFDVAVWNPVIETYVLTPEAPAGVPTPGQAYWGRFSSKTGGNLITAGSPVNSLSAGIGLDPGWNMVGDPYLSAVGISNLQIDTGNGAYTFASAVSNNLISPTLYGYNGSAYVPITSGASLEPWVGYWIYSNVSAELTFFYP